MLDLTPIGQNKYFAGIIDRLESIRGCIVRQLLDAVAPNFRLSSVHRHQLIRAMAMGPDVSVGSVDGCVRIERHRRMRRSRIAMHAIWVDHVNMCISTRDTVRSRAHRLKWSMGNYYNQKQWEYPALTFIEKCKAHIHKNFSR